MAMIRYYKVGFVVDDSGRYVYDSVLAGDYKIRASGSDFILIESTTPIGSEILDIELEELVAKLSLASDVTAYRDVLYDVISLYRYRAESRGITTPTGIAIPTDRTSVNLLTTGYLGLFSGVREKFRWRVAKDVWHDFSIDEMRYIVDNAFAWVEDTCWDAEERLQLVLQGLSNETLLQIETHDIAQWYENLISGREYDDDGAIVEEIVE